jgi:HSP20 family molecular chaperone IbpA
VWPSLGWDPFRDLLAIQQHLERSNAEPGSVETAGRSQETDNHYIVTAELPGVKQEDVHVAFNNGRADHHPVCGESASRGPAV